MEQHLHPSSQGKVRTAAQRGRRSLHELLLANTDLTHRQAKEVLKFIGDPPHLSPSPPRADPSTSLAELSPWHPTPLGGMGGTARHPKSFQHQYWRFPIYFHFSLPKLKQIFPGCESWTSNPVPNPHHVIQSGQKSNTSHLSESRCKCFPPQAQAAEAASDLYPFSPQTLQPC